MSPAEEPTAADPQYDPLLVVAVSGSTVAIWQVETDPTVARGDFSGAWLVTEEGVQGFAADAEWIPDTDNQAIMLQHLLRYSYLPAEGTTQEQIEKLVGEGGVEKKWDMGKPTTAKELVTAAQAEVEEARKEFARLAPGKKQPAWGEVGEIEPVEGTSPQGLEGDAAKAVDAALETARGLRSWLDEKQAFDKLKARRLDPLYEAE